MKPWPDNLHSLLTRVRADGDGRDGGSAAGSAEMDPKVEFAVFSSDGEGDEAQDFESQASFVVLL